MKRYAAPLLAAGALLTILTELLRYWIADHRPEWWVLSVAALFGFLGFYMINPAGAKDAFGFATDQAVKIIGVARSGRRATDPVIAIPQITPTVTDEADPSSTRPAEVKAPEPGPVVGALKERYEGPPPGAPARPGGE